MSENAVITNIVAPGGAVPLNPVLQALCDAYDEAVASQNNANTKPNKQFNETLLSKVKDRKLARQLKKTAERPVGFLDSGGGVHSLADIAGGSEGAEAATAAEECLESLASRPRMGQGSRCLRLALANMVRGKANGLGAHCDVDHVLQPDFQHPPGATSTPGRPVEIKQPDEGESHDGQKNNYAKCDPNADKACDCVPDDCPK